jgi:DNA-directed RNA polymerase specialized sigma24 family protein
MIEDLKKYGVKLSDEEIRDIIDSSELLIKSIDKFLPEIFKKKKWVYSIADYIVNRLNNSIVIDFRKDKKRKPYEIVVKNKDEAEDARINPEVEKRVNEIKGVLDILDKVAIAQALEPLTDIEREVFAFKEGTLFTGKVIAKMLNTTEDIIKKAYKSAKEKLNERNKE